MWIPCHTEGWHDPVDNPRITKYNSGGNVKPASGTYGWSRRNDNGTKKFHSGFDFFGIPGKDQVYACVDGTLQEVRKSEEAGWIVRIKVDNVKDLLNQEKKVAYKLQFKDELMGVTITEKDSAYLIYMHLQKVFFTGEDAKKKIAISSGTALGYLGVSGTIASGTMAPHLHMEVSTILNPFKTGEKYRANAARFVKLNSYDTPDQDEASKKHHVHKS